MSTRLIALLTLVPLGATPASAQVVRGGGGLSSSATTSRASVEDVIARVMSFDRDGDGLVGRAELNDRMQPLVDRWDSDGNGAFDRAEVRALAGALPESHAVKSDFLVGHYGFGDQIGISSRSHIEGAIEDLRLDAATRDVALKIANAFVDALESDLSSAFLASAGPWLMPEQLDALTRAIAVQDATRMVFAEPQATGITSTVSSIPGTVSAARSLVERFQLPPLYHDGVTEALDEYAGGLGVGEAERLALVRALEGVLDDEQLGNLGAALERRPVVSTAAVMVVRDGKVFVVAPRDATGPQGAPVFIDSLTAPAAR